jgi:WD40 repeat protein
MHAPDFPAAQDVLRALIPLPLSDVSPAFEWPNGVISSVAFSPGSDDLALACRDGNIVVCSLHPRGIRALLKGHSARAWSVAFSPDGKTLASASGEWAQSGAPKFVRIWDLPLSSVRVWDVQTGRSWALRDEGGPAEFSVAFSPDGKTLASGGRNQMVRVWDVASGRLIRAQRGHEDLVRSVAFHPDGRTIISAGFDATIRFWDAATGRQARDPIHIDRTAANCVVISRDGRTFAANTTGPDDPTQPPTAPGAIGFQTSAPGVIKVWDWSSGKERVTLRGCRSSILNLAFSPDGRVLASGGGPPGEVKLWDIESGRSIADLMGHRQWVESVAFSPDGKILATVGGSATGPGEIKLWSTVAPPGAPAGGAPMRPSDPTSLPPTPSGSPVR